MKRWARSILHLKRLPELGRCLRRARRPLSWVRRYLQIGRDDYPARLELRNGLAIDLNEFVDLITAWVVFFRDEYRVPSDVRTVLDLGANIGCFSLKTVREIPAARVIAVEPFPATHERLTANIARNGCEDRIRAWKLGV